MLERRSPFDPRAESRPLNHAGGGAEKEHLIRDPGGWSTPGPVSRRALALVYLTGYRGAMLWCVGMLVCLSMWLASGPASAVSLTWSISGGTFADGGTFSGTFVQDPAQPRPSTWDVNVVGGGSSFPAHSYTPANSSVLLLQWVPNAEPTYHFIDLADNRQLRLTPASPLDGSAATVPLSLLNNSGRVECFNCAPFRYITGGSLVLESATPTLILESIAPDPTVVGATTTATISIDAIAALGPPTGSITIYDTSGDAICSFPLPTTSCSFAPTAPGGLSVVRAIYRRRQLPERNFERAVVHHLAGGGDHGNPRPGSAKSNRDRRGDHRDSNGCDGVGYPPPTGLITVFFYGSGDTTLCTITLPATTCTFAPKAGGNQTVAAQYSGDASYASGYSNQQPITVAPVPPVVTLVSFGAQSDRGRHGDDRNGRGRHRPAVRPADRYDRGVRWHRWLALHDHAAGHLVRVHADDPAPRR